MLVDQREVRRREVDCVRVPVDRRGQDRIRVRAGCGHGHRDTADKDNPNGGRCGHEPERIARARDQALAPGSDVIWRPHDRYDAGIGYRHRPGQGQVPGNAHESQRNHAVGVGADPTQETEVLYEHPIGQAEHDKGEQGHTDDPGPSDEERSANRGQGDDHEEVDAPTRGLRRMTQSSLTHDERTCEAEASGPSAGPSPVSVPTPPDRVWPLQKPRPGQAWSSAMPTKKTPIDTQDGATESSGRPGPLGKGDEGAGGAVEEDCARRAEQPGQTRGEDPAKGLAEHPDYRGPTRRSPARRARDHCPRGTISSHRPIPIWIHTAAAAAWTG